jgi:predicted O-linked N-acetylglucosamine transferase (SPINDLY family)
MTRKNKKFTNPFLKKKDGAGQPIAIQSDANIQTAIALHQQGEIDRAEQIYQSLLSVNPINSEVLHLLGVIAYQRGQFQHAIDLISVAIEISPDIPDFFVNKGNALQELKLLEEAIACYEQAIVLNPNYAEAYINMGAALKDLSRLQEAIKSFDKAILLRPDLAEAHSNKGIALKGLNDFQSAIASYEKAIAINPNYAEAHYNRGISLQELKQLEAAVESYDRAIAVNPTYAEAYANRGAAYKDLKKIEAAIDSFDEAFEINPNMEYLIGMRQHARMFVCDWGGFDNQILELRRRIQLGMQATTCLSAVALPITAKEQLEVSKVWVRNHHPYNPCLGPIPKYANPQKIRIGYFSADFQNHATAHLMAELFELHDKDKFELIAFSFGPNLHDEMRQRISLAFDQFIDVTTLSDLEVAQLSRKLGIHIAIDLKGLTQDSRLGIFSYRAAPIQVSYLGYPGSLGAEYIDYLIADKTLIPEMSQPYYSEKIVYLPYSYQVNDRKKVIADTQFTKNELGLPLEGFVFCCFNSNYKITPEVFNSWIRILKAVEGSVLWLFEDNSSASFNLRKEAQARGLDPNRIIFAPRMQLPEHLARHKLADLFLDTNPCNAHTTASDALWSGLPVLTWMGESFASRVAGSLLQALDLPELIATGQEEYEQLAIDLATNTEKLKSIKNKLKRNRLKEPLFDTPTFAKHLETAYTKMFEKYQTDSISDHIYIEP